ncbi:MAG: immunoglobulin domain-containing protein, partial [Verrucomicrobiota bacterium]
VRGIEAYNGFGGHIGLQYSTHIDVTGNYIHEAHEYDGGGSGYGVRMEFKSSECLVEDNIFRMLRHAMLSQAGPNGNVFGYNYSRENYWNNGINPTDLTSDITGHGNMVYANLFEGNICQHIWIDDSHGDNGPLNTFFRNRAELRGINVSTGQTEGQNYVGNEAFENTYTLFFVNWPGDGYSLQGGNNFEHGNLTESDGLQAPGTATLGDYSYYLSCNPTSPPPVPDFWTLTNSIPTIGPPHPMVPAKTIPAYERYFAGGSRTRGPPSIAAQPTNLTVSAGGAASFSVEAYGTPAATYRWLKDGVPIAGGTNATLMIANSTSAHAGIYRVIVEDANGFMRSAPAVLTVVTPAGRGTMILIK